MFIPSDGTERGLYDIFLFERGKIMKEIGEQLKNKREENGVSVDEAAEDLKLRPIQITNLENGNMEYFKDILSLKYFIRDYAKYLGVDFEKLLDQFNEFLFDYTSKIPTEEIERAKLEQFKNKTPKEISSPYTIERKTSFNIPKYVIILILMIACLIGFIILNNNEKENTTITYNIEKR